MHTADRPASGGPAGGAAMSDGGPAPGRVVAALRALAPPVCAYVYDRDALRAAADAVRAALPAGSLLCYAVKANSHPAVVAALAGRVDGLEVASGGELALAGPLAGSTRAGLTIFGGPGKTDAELAAAVAAGALVTVESVHELRRLTAVAAAAGGTDTPVLLRVNRAGGVGLVASRYLSGVPTPFGIDEAELDAAVAAVRPPVRVVGLHLQAVSNNLDAAAHAAFVTDAVRWSARAAARLGIGLRYVDVGGGFGVGYADTPADDHGDGPQAGVHGDGPQAGVHGGVAPCTARFDLDALRSGLVAAAAALPAGARLVFEPGRLLAAAAGWYAAEVLDVKRVHGRWFAVLRGGTHHFRLPAAWDYSHPFEIVEVDGWAYPFDRPAVHDAPVDVVGELCTPRDVLARGRRVGRLRAGDVLVFANAGAYGWDISHHGFLRHPHPQFIVL